MGGAGGGGGGGRFLADQVMPTKCQHVMYSVVLRGVSIVSFQEPLLL